MMSMKPCRNALLMLLWSWTAFLGVCVAPRLWRECRSRDPFVVQAIEVVSLVPGGGGPPSRIVWWRRGVWNPHTGNWAVGEEVPAGAGEARATHHLPPKGK